MWMSVEAPMIPLSADEAAALQTGPPPTPPPPSAQPGPAGLNPRYTFDTFIVGSSNQFAHAACRAVAEATGPASCEVSSSKVAMCLRIFASGVGLSGSHGLTALS